MLEYIFKHHFFVTHTQKRNPALDRESIKLWPRPSVSVFGKLGSKSTKDKLPANGAGLQ